jgi:hypothetical protein
MIVSRWHEVHHYTDDGSVEVYHLQTKKEVRRFFGTIQDFHRVYDSPCEFFVHFRVALRVDGAKRHRMTGLGIRPGFDANFRPGRLGMLLEVTGRNRE